MRQRDQRAINRHAATKAAVPSIGSRIQHHSASGFSLAISRPECRDRETLADLGAHRDLDRHVHIGDEGFVALEIHGRGRLAWACIVARASVASPSANAIHDGSITVIAKPL